MSIEHTPEDASAPRADLVAALAWMAFGGAVAVGAWNMDRLERLHINRYEAPGLVPGVLGAVIFLLGLALALRSLRRGAFDADRVRRPLERGRHLAQVLVATLVYALVLVGRGLPFWFATFAFVTAFILHFDHERQAALGRRFAAQAWRAAVYGVATSGIVTLVFERIFLVRLP
jgi:xanthine/uracil permease